MTWGLTPKASVPAKKSVVCAKHCELPFLPFRNFYNISWAAQLRWLHRHPIWTEEKHNLDRRRPNCVHADETDRPT